MICLQGDVSYISSLAAFFYPFISVPLVYIVGLDNIAKDESNIFLRNQLFTALTRSKAWVCLSGIKENQTQQEYPLYQEMRQILAGGTTICFTYKRSPKRDISDD